MPTDPAWPAFLADRSVLITGGTGSFGRACARRLLSTSVRRIIVFSRDECKQAEMARDFLDARLRWFLGDVRDVERLAVAFRGVDYVVHAAALKQIPACEANPVEAIRTNVLGAVNVVHAALRVGVQRVLALSSDKAVNPVNLYGATKLCAEKLLVQANVWAGRRPCRYAVVRYGNILGSRGSVTLLWAGRGDGQPVPVTDRRMTRFWWTQAEAVDFALGALRRMRGGEIFVPLLPAVGLTVLAERLHPGAPVREVGRRRGEKLHEVLVSQDEAPFVRRRDDTAVICPDFLEAPEGYGEPVPEGWEWTSNGAEAQGAAPVTAGPGQ